MVGLTEISSFAASVKGVSDLVRGFVSLKSEADKNAAVIEIQRLLLEVQFAALDSAAKIEELKAKINEYEDWGKNRDYYKLKQTQFGFNYMESTENNPSDVKHMACASCFQNQKIVFLQPTNSDARVFRCNACNDRVQMLSDHSPIRTIARNRPYSDY